MRTFRTGSVPCGDCRMCCENELVPLRDEEVGYEVEMVGGLRFLAHNGRKCFYLTQEGCSIYARRPMICREFDCRVIAAKISKSKARKLRCEDTWKKGRKLLETIQPG